MPNHVNIKEVGELIEEDFYDMNWFSYDLGGNWGGKLSKYTKKRAKEGLITPGIENGVSVKFVHDKLKNGSFDGIAGFYVGILCFFGEKVYPEVDFVEKTPHSSVNKVVSGLECPERFKDELYSICHSEYDFEDFIWSASKLERTNFDVDSAISVYKLQGDDAIFPLLCQIFYVNKGIDCLSTCLINDLPVQLSVSVSDYVSGCTFPVAVSPAVSDYKWGFNDNGWFLYGNLDDSWLVLDVVGVGRVNLSNYALTNRLNYLGGGGECVPYLICWNWGEIVQAYHFFGRDLLIRDLKNTIFDHYWFIFGPNSKINVSCRHGYINGESDFGIVHQFDDEVKKGKTSYVTTTLSQDFVCFCDKEDVIYSKSEIFDWFELGNMLM